MRELKSQSYAGVHWSVSVPWPFIILMVLVLMVTTNGFIFASIQMIALIIRNVEEVTAHLVLINRYRIAKKIITKLNLVQIKVRKITKNVFLNSLLTVGSESPHHEITETFRFDTMTWTTLPDYPYGKETILF